MNNRAATLVPLVLMALLVAVTYWLYQVIQANSPRAPLRHDPDYIVEQFTVRRFAPDGSLQHTLHAEKMVHYPDDDTSLITLPHLVYHRQPPTEVFARRALVGKDGEEIDLIDEVRVIRQGLPGMPPTLLETRLLKVFPDKETATTTTPVTITKGQSIVHGSGLDLDNKTGITRLHGRVNATLYRNRNH